MKKFSRYKSEMLYDYRIIFYQYILLKPSNIYTVHRVIRVYIGEIMAIFA